MANLLIHQQRVSKLQEKLDEQRSAAATQTDPHQIDSYAWAIRRTEEKLAKAQEDLKVGSDTNQKKAADKIPSLLSHASILRQRAALLITQAEALEAQASRLEGKS